MNNCLKSIIITDDSLIQFTYSFFNLFPKVFDYFTNHYFAFILKIITIQALLQNDPWHFHHQLSSSPIDLESQHQVTFLDYCICISFLYFQQLPKFIIFSLNLQKRLC